MKPSKNYHLPVLMYHRVVRSRAEAGKHKIWVLEKNFRKQLEYLKSKGFETVTFKDIDKNPNMDFSNPRKIILTFDDGYEDNYTLAFPLLKKYGFRAVIFLVTKLHQNEWGIVEGELAVSLLNAGQIQEMDNWGIEFGGHTQTHKVLNIIKNEDARVEISECKNDVEQITGKPAISFAYPFGGINNQIKKLVRESGYKFGISTNTGPLDFFEDPMQIRRIEVGPKTSSPIFKYKVSGEYFTRKSFWSFFSAK